EQEHLNPDERQERDDPRLRAGHRVLPLVLERDEVVPDVVNQNRQRDQERDREVNGVPEGPPPPVPSDYEADEPRDHRQPGRVLPEDAAPEDQAAEGPYD